MYFVIPLRTPGVILTDLLPRLYLNEIATAVPVGTTLSDLGGGNYLLDGLPDGDPSLCYTLTYEFSGVWYSIIWGGWKTTGQAPTRVIVPVRIADLDATSLGLILYRAGELQTVDFQITEIGSPGDYRISGWEQHSDGAVNLLTWLPAGELTWTEESIPPPGVFLDRASTFELISSIMSNWTATIRFDPGDTVDPPEPSSDWSSAYLAWALDGEDVEWTDMNRGRRIDSAVRHGIWVEKGAGERALQSLIDSVESLYPLRSSNLTFLPGYVQGSPEERGSWSGVEFIKPFVRLEPGNGG